MRVLLPRGCFVLESTVPHAIIYPVASLFHQWDILTKMEQILQIYAQFWGGHKIIPQNGTENMNLGTAKFVHSQNLFQKGQRW